MTLQLIIDDVDRSGILDQSSPECSDEMNSRNTLDLSLTYKTATVVLDIGDPVLLYDSEGTLLFGGVITDHVKHKMDGNVAMECDVNCVDFNQLADRHLVAEVYENMKAGDIVKGIVANFMAGEGLTVVGVEDGPTVEKFVCNYIFATDAFNELASVTGYAWNIAYDKDFKFYSRSTFTAPFALTETSKNFKNLCVKRSISGYRNRQYLRGGKDLTESRTESWKGDGTSRTFVTAFPVGEDPTSLFVGGVPKTLGIRGVDTGRQWYWSKGVDTITQDTSETVVPVGTVITMTYRGQWSILCVAMDDDAVLERQAAEGGSGIYDAIVDDPSIDSYALAVDKVIGLLRQKGLIQDVVTFETEEPGLFSGQLLSIAVDLGYGLNGDYLIESVNAYMDGMDLSYSVSALSGERVGSWVDFFRKLAAGSQGFSIRENELLAMVQNVRDGAAVNDELSTTEGVRDTRAGSAYAGYCEAM